MVSYYKKTIILSDFTNDNLGAKNIRGMVKLEKSNRICNVAVSLIDVRVIKNCEYLLGIRCGDYIQKISLGNGENTKGVHSLSDKINLESDILCVLMQSVNGEVACLASGSIGAMNGVKLVQEFIKSKVEKPVVKQPIVEEVKAVEKPVVEQPIVEEVKAVEKPVVEQPIVEEVKAVEKPVVEQPIVEEVKAVEKPVVKQPIVEEVDVIEKPVVKQSVEVEHKAEENIAIETQKDIIENATIADEEIAVKEETIAVNTTTEVEREAIADQVNKTETEMGTEKKINILESNEYMDEVVVTENYYEASAVESLSDEDKELFKDVKGTGYSFEEVEQAEQSEATVENKEESISGDINQENMQTDELKYFKQIERQLDSLFTTYPSESNLCEAIEQSKWARIDFNNDGKYYVVGLIYNEDKPMCICYGVPDRDNKIVPKELLGYAEWLPVKADDNNMGYWMMYQDCNEGKCITGLV